VARKPNYSFEKRRKELDRKSKKEEKRQRRLERAEGERDEATETLPDEAPPATQE
jgi:chromosome condensin MukBEF ATPase and DNA-binding subunit MukB